MWCSSACVVGMDASGCVGDAGALLILDAWLWSREGGASPESSMSGESRSPSLVPFPCVSISHVVAMCGSVRFFCDKNKSTGLRYFSGGDVPENDGVPSVPECWVV